MTISGLAWMTAAVNASASNTSTSIGRAEFTKECAIVRRTCRAPDFMAMGDKQRREPPANHARSARQEDPPHETSLAPISRQVLGSQIFVEPINGPLPRFLRRRLVVARRRVVVEAVVGVLVDVALVGHASRA